jgi:hypothetical protein
MLRRMTGKRNVPGSAQFLPVRVRIAVLALTWRVKNALVTVRVLHALPCHGAISSSVRDLARRA